MNCVGKYYELVNIKRLKPWKNSPDTLFGTLIHNSVQDVLSDKRTAEEASAHLKKVWGRLFTLFKLDPKFKNHGAIGEKITLYIKGFLTRTYGKFTVKHIEYKIKKKLDDFPQDFKGYIDIVIQLENGKYIIADFKTANSVYYFEQYRDKIKDYQIILYKKFYSELENVSLEDIETSFIVFEKTLESKKPVQIIEVGSSPVKMKNANEWLQTSAKLINQKKFYKNKISCLKFGQNHPCCFYGTPLCTR